MPTSRSRRFLRDGERRGADEHRQERRLALGDREAHGEVVALQEPAPARVAARVAEERGRSSCSEPKLSACAFCERARVRRKPRDLLRAIDVVEPDDARGFLVALARQRCTQKIVRRAASLRGRDRQAAGRGGGAIGTARSTNASARRRRARTAPLRAARRRASASNARAASVICSRARRRPAAAARGGVLVRAQARCTAGANERATMDATCCHRHCVPSIASVEP